MMNIQCIVLVAFCAELGGYSGLELVVFCIGVSRWYFVEDCRENERLRAVLDT